MDRLLEKIYFSNVIMNNCLGKSVLEADLKLNLDVERDQKTDSVLDSLSLRNSTKYIHIGDILYKNDKTPGNIILNLGNTEFFTDERYVFDAQKQIFLKAKELEEIHRTVSIAGLDYFCKLYRKEEVKGTANKEIIPTAMDFIKTYHTDDPRSKELKSKAFLD